MAGLGYLAAFIPPVALRRLQQRAVAFDLGQSFLGAPVDGDPDALWVALAHAARTITNGPAAVIALGTPPAVRIVDGTPPTPLQVGAPYDGPALSDGKDAAGDATISLPIESDLGRQGWLVVHPDAGSLFLDDDRVLLSLLAGQAARAAERREAIRQQGVLESELEDASHELEFSRAQLESEARFRAALEAHPGILLVIEPDGRVGYANGQALRSLGYSATRSADVARRPARPAAGRSPSDVGSGEARRRDGTTFPVDFAVSTFESRGEQSSIAVLIDITDRLENDHLRDTFIGILSHELRTPVTAIYGGSQVLLGRGEKLDPAVSRELIDRHRGRGRTTPPADREPAGARPRRARRGTDRRRAGPPPARPADDRRTRAGDLARHEHHGRRRAAGCRRAWPRRVRQPGHPQPAEQRGQVRRADGARRDRRRGRRRRRDASASSTTARGSTDEVADRLFDLYYRAPGAAVVAPGAGIGLFVCRRIVTSLGGTIWAKSRPEGGAEFGFSLPIYEADEDLAPDPRRAAAGSSRRRPSPRLPRRATPAASRPSRRCTSCVEGMAPHEPYGRLTSQLVRISHVVSTFASRAPWWSRALAVSACASTGSSGAPSLVGPVDHHPVGRRSAVGRPRGLLRRLRSRRSRPPGRTSTPRPRRPSRRSSASGPIEGRDGRASRPTRPRSPTWITTMATGGSVSTPPPDVTTAFDKLKAFADTNC